MCRSGLGLIRRGIPIPMEVHLQFPQHVQEAWTTFDKWWKVAVVQQDPVARSTMPEEVAKAMQVILEAPIPGHEGATGKDSCYMVGVRGMMTD